MSSILNKPETLEDHESDAVTGGTAYGRGWALGTVTMSGSSSADAVEDSHGEVTLIRS